MYRLQRRSAPLILCLFAAFAMVLQFPVATIAATNVTTEISHKPVDPFVSGQRLRVLAEVEDEAGVNLVRCYFKTPEEADFVFVPMSLDENGQYAGILPAPDTTTESIEYLFLVVNGNNAVVKSQIFTAEKGTDSKAVAGPAYENSIQVYSEVSAEAAPAGFADSIAMDLVESGARFGIVAGGLYLADAATAAGTTGAAASASAAGTVAAATGISTTTLVLGGLAAAAIVGGAAAAGGGGSGGDGESSSDTKSTESTTNDYTWQSTYNYIGCSNKAYGTFTFHTVNGIVKSYTWDSDDAHSDCTVSGHETSTIDVSELNSKYMPTSKIFLEMLKPLDTKSKIIFTIKSYTKTNIIVHAFDTHDNSVEIVTLTKK